MELMISQKNELLKLIKGYGLEPFNFKWYKDDDDSTLRYKDTDFGFSVNIVPGYFDCTYSPSESFIYNSYRGYSWGEVIGVFMEWLSFLKREISQPDLWEELDKIKLLDNIEFDVKDTMQQFTYQEIKQIQSGVEEVRNYLLNIASNNDEDSKIINEKLDYLIESSERMGRKDWANIFYGAMVGLSITLVLDPQQGQTMVNLFKNAVSGIIKFIGA